jgi:hypothetical protein
MKMKVSDSNYVNYNNDKEKKQLKETNEENKNLGSLTLLIIIFGSSLFLLYTIYLSFPNLQE